MFNFAPEQLPQLLKFWGYPLMFLLMIVEGPIIAIVSAFLASLGYFNIAIVLGLSISGDIIGDMILYYIGYSGGPKILPKVQKFLGVQGSVLEKLKSQFHKNSERIIFYVKSTTGLSYITFITAGTLHMRFSKFLKNIILGGLIWSSFLVTVGYFFGYAAKQISQYIKYAGIFVFVGAVLFLIGLTLYKKRQTREILE